MFGIFKKKQPPPFTCRHCRGPITEALIRRDFAIYPHSELSRGLVQCAKCGNNEDFLLGGAANGLRLVQVFILGAPGPDYTTGDEADLEWNQDFGWWIRCAQEEVRETIGRLCPSLPKEPIGKGLFMDGTITLGRFLTQVLPHRCAFMRRAVSRPDVVDPTETNWIRLQFGDLPSPMFEALCESLGVPVQGPGPLTEYLSAPEQHVEQILAYFKRTSDAMYPVFHGQEFLEEALAAEKKLNVVLLFSSSLLKQDFQLATKDTKLWKRGPNGLTSVSLEDVRAGKVEGEILASKEGGTVEKAVIGPLVKDGVERVPAGEVGIPLNGKHCPPCRLLDTYLPAFKKNNPQTAVYIVDTAPYVGRNPSKELQELRNKHIPSLGWPNGKVLERGNASGPGTEMIAGYKVLLKGQNAVPQYILSGAYPGKTYSWDSTVKKSVHKYR